MFALHTDKKKLNNVLGDTSLGCNLFWPQNPFSYLHRIFYYTLQLFHGNEILLIIVIRAEWWRNIYYENNVNCFGYKKFIIIQLELLIFTFLLLLFLQRNNSVLRKKAHTIVLGEECDVGIPYVCLGAIFWNDLILYGNVWKCVLNKERDKSMHIAQSQSEQFLIVWQGKTWGNMTKYVFEKFIFLSFKSNKI